MQQRHEGHVRNSHSLRLVCISPRNESFQGTFARVHLKPKQTVHRPISYPSLILRMVLAI